MNTEFSTSNHLPQGLVKRYRAAFIPSHYTPFAIQTLKQQPRRSWFTEQRTNVFLTDHKITAHLQGKYYVGPVAKIFTRSLCIDLDRGTHWRSLDKRTERVCDVFDEAAPLIFSTPRGGRHLHFMLDDPGWADRTAAFARDRLRDASLEVEPGKIEVFPAGERALRAPLGQDCSLLDDSFSPLPLDRSGQLHTLNDILEQQHYDTLSIPADYRATEVPPSPTRARKRPLIAPSSAYMLRVDRWLRQGLTGPSERNEAFLDLTWFFRVIWHFDEERAIQELWAWIQQYHNRQSEEYNRDPGGVFKKVQAVVRCFSWDKVGLKSSDKGHRRGPNTGDSLEGSIQAHLDAAPLDARERAFLGDLLRYAHLRGQETLDGCIEVQIPSRTLNHYRLKAVGCCSD